MSRRHHPFSDQAVGRAPFERRHSLAFALRHLFRAALRRRHFRQHLHQGLAHGFQAKPPFVNTTFLTEAPESLYVFEWQGKKLEMGDKEFRAFKAQHPAAADVKTDSYVYCAGGIFPCIVGTVLLVVGSMAIALILGVCAAIYLNEYAATGRSSAFVRLAILNLAGVPSIVFGLFGFGMFVIFFGWNVSLLAGLVHAGLHGAARWSSRPARSRSRPCPRASARARSRSAPPSGRPSARTCCPTRCPGILTSSILGIARVAGETAPIMFTAAYVVRDKLPWQVEKLTDFFFQGVMALPYHIYVVSSKIPQNEYTERVQYGTAFVFLFIVADRDRLDRASLQASQPLQMVVAAPLMEPCHPAPTPPSARPQPRQPRAAPCPAPAAATLIDIDHVDFFYGATQALHDISLQIQDKKVTAFIGPSGCGKSTLLRCLNRMNDLIDGTRVAGARSRSAASTSTARTSTSSSCASASAWSSKNRIPSRNPSTKTSPTACASQGVKQQGPTRRGGREKPARRRALGRGEGPPARQRPRPVRRPAAAPLHRPRHRGRARDHPDGRALLGARSHRHGQGRGTDPAVEDSSYTIVIVTHNMQQAGALLGQDGLFLPRQADRVRRPPKRSFTNPAHKQTERAFERAIRGLIERDDDLCANAIADDVQRSISSRSRSTRDRH